MKQVGGADHEECHVGTVVEQTHKQRIADRHPHNNRVAQPHFHASGWILLKPTTPCIRYGVLDFAADVYGYCQTYARNSWSGNFV